MKKVNISKLTSSINYTRLLEDFVVVQFTQSNGYIKFGAQFIDEFSQNVLAKSVVFENGSSLFTLFAKAQFSNIDLRTVLADGTDMDGLNFTILNQEQLKSIPQHLVVQLLLNSLNTAESSRLQFNNLTGKLFLFKESLFEKRKFGKNQLITKIPAIEVKIHKDKRLELRTTTFTSLLLNSKLKFTKKKLRDYAKYTYVHSTKSMRRILKDENLDAKDVFIIKQEANKKTVIPFMDFGDYEAFLESKMGHLSLIDSKRKRKISDYLSLSYQGNEIEKTYRLKSSESSRINSILKEASRKIHIFNGVSEEGSDYVEVLVQSLTALFPNLSISTSGKHRDNALNIKLVHNRSYYNDNNIPDPYQTAKGVTQHLTIEDFNFKSNSALKAVVKELLIKDDVSKRQVSLVDWSSYKFSTNQIFGIEVDESYYFLTISPNGKMKFEKKELSLFSQSEFDDLISIFSGQSDIEGIVKDESGDINIIKRTDVFTIPNFTAIATKLEAESKIEEFNVADVIRWLSDCEIDETLLQKYITEIKQSDDSIIVKSELLRIISHRSIKKKLSKLIESETGVIIKTYLRDQSKYEIMDSNLDIHSYSKDGKLYYFVGTVGDGMRDKITRASVVREILGYNNSQVFFERLLPLMNVDFVRYGDLTVIPFPFKYLREWAMSNSRINN